MQVRLQIAARVFVEHDAFLFKHALLFVVRQHEAAGRALALRIQYAMPGRAVGRTVHAEADCPRRVTFAEQFGNLAISHDPARRDAAHD